MIRKERALLQKRPLLPLIRGNTSSDFLVIKNDADGCILVGLRYF